MMRTQEDQAFMINLRNVAESMYALLNEGDAFINIHGQDENNMFLMTMFGLLNRRYAMAELFEKIDNFLVKMRVDFPYEYTFAHNGMKKMIGTPDALIEAIQLDSDHYKNYLSGYKAICAGENQKAEKNTVKTKKSVSPNRLFCSAINMGSSDSSSASESSRLEDDAKSSNSLSQ